METSLLSDSDQLYSKCLNDTDQDIVYSVDLEYTFLKSSKLAIWSGKKKIKQFKVSEW